MGIKKGDKVICAAENMRGVFRVTNTYYDECRDESILVLKNGIFEEHVPADDCVLFKNPADLSHAELAGIVEGLREMMYADTQWVDDPDGECDKEVDVWDPDCEVDGCDLVDWVCVEMAKHNLVPPAGPRSATEEVV